MQGPSLRARRPRARGIEARRRTGVTCRSVGRRRGGSRLGRCASCASLHGWRTGRAPFGAGGPGRYRPESRPDWMHFSSPFPIGAGGRRRDRRPVTRAPSAATGQRPGSPTAGSRGTSANRVDDGLHPGFDGNTTHIREPDHREVRSCAEWMTSPCRMDSCARLPGRRPRIHGRIETRSSSDDQHDDATTRRVV